MITLVIQGCGTPVVTGLKDEIQVQRQIFEHYHGNIFAERDAHPHEIAKAAEERINNVNISQPTN